MGRMRIRRTTVLALAAASAMLPAHVVAQSMLESNLQSQPKPTPESLKGRAAVDLIPGKRSGLGYSLRYGNVIPGSVRLEVDGQLYQEGKDYTLDYAAGAVFIGVPVKESSSIRVSYRHDPTKKQASNGGALPLLSMNFGNSGSVRMLIGFSGTQRFADGTMAQATNTGLQNSLSFRGGNLSGLFLVSSQSEATVMADGASPDKSAPQKGQNATDTLIMQNFDYQVGEVTITAEYTDVGDRFIGFGMLQSSGISEDRAKQIEKEKGITRMGFGVSKNAPKGLSFKNSYRTIDDGKHQITFQEYGLKSSGFELNYSSRAIDREFSRFKDLAEGDRAQLQKERGITREVIRGKFGFGPGELKFEQNSISEGGKGIYRQTLALNSSWVKAGWATQEISSEFGRANDLSDDQRAQWHKERGMKRESFDFATGEAIKGFALQYGSKSVKYDGRAFETTSFDVSTGVAQLQWWRRGSSESFGRLADLSQAELDGMIQQTLRMYDLKAGMNENDRGFIVREAGLQRDFLRLTSNPVKDVRLSFQRSGIQSSGGGLEYTVFGVDGKSIKVDYRRTNISENFTRVHDLLEGERKFYGLQTGFDRRDMAVQLSLGGKSKLDLRSLSVTSANGGLERYTANLALPGLEFRGAYRSVDDNFARVGDVNDGERQFLRELIGYRQFDAGLKYTGLKAISLEAFLYDADNGREDLHRYKRNLALAYTPNSASAWRLLYNSHKLDGAPGSLYENDLFVIQGFQDFGRFGKFTARKERESFSGPQGTLPDRETYYAKYETKLGPKNDFATEQIRTNFSDGGYENIQTYKFGWQVNHRLNVRVTEILLDRDGTKPDLRTRSYGASYDFGNNLKLGWSWHRELDSTANGKRNYNWTLTPGELFGFQFGGSYDEKRIDGTRTTALGNFSFKNPKPINVGFVKNLQINVGYDSHTDAGAWKKENTLASVAFQAFGSGFGADYTHIMLPNQHRVVDRTLRFSYDPSGKKPLQANFVYKLRTLPDGVQQVIRDYDVSYKLDERFTLSHSMDTLPEKAQQNVPFGSLAQPRAKNTWAISWNMSPSTLAKFGYHEERLFDQRSLVRRLNASVELFKDAGSPLILSYGVDQNQRPDGKRFTRSSYELLFEQKPGPNQSLSFAFGYVNWRDGIGVGEMWNHWNLRLDYQLRF